MAEISIARNHSRKDSISIDFTMGDRNEVSVSKERGRFGQDGYRPATLNWSALGQQPVALAQDYAALIQHAAAYAAMLDTLTDEALDAMGAAAEVEEARRLGFDLVEGKWVPLATTEPEASEWPELPFAYPQPDTQGKEA